MYRSAGLLSLLMVSALALRCDYKGYKDVTDRSDESMEWFNTLSESWYQTNKRGIFNMVKESVNVKLMTGLPDWILSLELDRLEFSEGTVPAVTRVRTDQDMVRCLNEVNQEVKLRRVTFDVNLLLHSKGSIALLAIKLLLGVSGQLSLNGVTLMAQARLEVLMNTQQEFPGLVSATFSFTERPIFACNVDMYNLIGLDTFGIDKWVNEKVEDIIQQQLVYPGMLFMDLTGLSTGQALQTTLVSGIHGDFKEWPAAYSVAVKISPADHNTNESEFVVKVGSADDSAPHMERIKHSGEVQFDLALESLANPEVEVKVTKDVSFAVDPVIVSKQVDLTIILDGNTMNKSYSIDYQDDQGSWKIDVNVWAYLLPAAVIEQRGVDVVHYPTFASEANCNEDCPQLGVLYLHLHKAEGIAHGDPGESVDPNVRVYLNNQQVYKSGTIDNSSDPVFDERFQILIRTKYSTIPEISDQTLRFDVFDYDKFTDDDFLGQTSVNLSTDVVLNKALYLQKRASKVGYSVLYVSMVFKPVPFYK